MTETTFDLFLFALCMALGMFTVLCLFVAIYEDKE